MIVVAVLMGAAVVALTLWLLAAVTATALTLVDARRHRRLAADLDAALVEILGPRTPEAPQVHATGRG
jgi:hypothetical protein